MASRPLPPNGEILLCQTEDGRTRIECRFQDETLWLSQALIADLFQVTVPTVNEHLKNIFEERELEPQPTIRNFRIVRREGKREVAREIEHYSLDAILAVGYRVRSPRGTQFRRWATERLKEYLVKGFTMDDERLRNPPVEGSGVPDYFDELLERIRDIRASERRMYLRVKEIFALAADYEAAHKSTVEFFKIIQNKLHFAATGHTAAELIARRANHAARLRDQAEVHLFPLGAARGMGQPERVPDLRPARDRDGARAASDHRARTAPLRGPGWQAVTRVRREHTHRGRHGEL